MVIVVGTFILEDVATVAAATEASAGHLGLSVALISLYLGIVVGDVGLYGLGVLASHFPWARRWKPTQMERGKSWIENHVFRLVFAARFLPGARLPTYTACGFLRADVMRFVLATASATLLWTTSLFLISLRLGKMLLSYSVWWRWAGMACFLVVIVLIGRFCVRLSKESS